MVTTRSAAICMSSFSCGCGGCRRLGLEIVRAGGRDAHREELPDAQLACLCDAHHAVDLRRIGARACVGHAVLDAIDQHLEGSSDAALEAACAQCRGALHEAPMALVLDLVGDL